MTVLQAERFTAGYGRRKIIEDCTFSICAGEMVGLLGRNGSGKSTLIKGLCNLTQNSGMVRITGDERSHLTTREIAQRIAYLPQKSGISLSLPVREVILMGCNPTLGLLEQPSSAQQSEAERLAYASGLDPVANFQQLSEGQKQLALFARAMIQDAKLLLLDEPDSALDFVNRHALLAEICAYVHREQRAALLCMHDVNFALRYCDRLLLIDEGRLLLEQTLSSCTEEALEAALRQIYGDIRLVRAEGNRIMLWRDDHAK